MALPSSICSTNIRSVLLELIFIGYTTVMYFTLGFIISFITNKIIGDFDEKNCKNKTTIQLFGEIVSHLYIVGIILFICKKIIFSLPLPLNSFKEFKNISELHNIYVLNFVVLYFHNNFKYKLDYIIKRFSK